LITGPTHGVGRATALALAGQGHRLILLCRNRALGQALCAKIRELPGSAEPRLLIADLGDMSQVNAAADALLDSGDALHVLINNAGVVNDQRRVVRVNGHEQEQMFAVNHLGHFLLTRRLLPRLIETARRDREPSRIVVVSSEAHALFCRGIDFEDIERRRSFATFRVYGETKLANILMVRELARRLDPQLVQVNSLHPGAVNSQLGANNQQRWYTGLVRLLLRLFFISPEKGARTSIHLATGPVDTQGAYYARNKPRRVKPWGEDDGAARRLWQLSSELLGLDVEKGHLSKPQAE
jgi:NAD(P)-dependent dehydrogenase (short-subunit alcohol dehydrogenase family)